LSSNFWMAIGTRFLLGSFNCLLGTMKVASLLPLLLLVYVFVLHTRLSVASSPILLSMCKFSGLCIRNISWWISSYRNVSCKFLHLIHFICFDWLLVSWNL
jgi:hypothetical protein